MFGFFGSTNQRSTANNFAPSLFTFVEQRRRVDKEENYRDLSEGEIMYTELG